MKPGRYAAADGSFGRSAGGAVGRGVLLLSVAVAIGIVLLNATDTDPPGTRVDTASRAADPEEEETPAAGRTTTTAAPVPTQPARVPKDVKVIVVNASGVKGAASKASDVLKPPGYNVLAPTNATAKESAVFFTPGYDREAAAIAAVLQFPATAVKPAPTPPPLPDPKGANVIVIVAADQAGRFGAAPAGSTTTTTTAPATTTTKKP